MSKGGDGTSYSIQIISAEECASALRDDPAHLVTWCRDNLKLHDDISLRYVQLSPSRIWDTKLADKISRDIFFVAMCRSFGVPAWRDTVTGDVKYEKEGAVYNVDFDAQQQKVSPKGKLMLRYKGISLLDDPKYKTHFTLSRFEDGTFNLLNFNGSWASLFREPHVLDCGWYMITSGSRMSGGNVCADVDFFRVEEGKTTVADLVIRDDSAQVRVIGSFDSESRYLKPDGTETSVLATTGRGYFTVIIADYGTEPTNHAFMDISAVADELEKWGRPILVIFASDEDYRKFRADQFKLPSTVSFGIDADGKIRQAVASEMKAGGNGTLPMIVMADTFNRVVFFSQGYTIGLGEKIIKTSKAL